MTQHLYYENAYVKTFDAQIIGRRTIGERPAVVLDRTAFYPEGGGQPADRGTLGGAAVVDAVMDEDGAVVHLLDGVPPDGEHVTGVLDWARRFDHMQHHTGQHMLSAAFIQVAGAQTVGFHLGEESVTIDLDTPALRDRDIDAAEDLANRAVWENLPVRAWFPKAEELAALEVRKAPDAAPGKLRIVQIGGMDATGCGGTHVAHTGEVGVVKVLKTGRRGDKTRVEFRCGARALLDYRQKNATAQALASALTVGTWELEEAIARLQDDYKTLRSALSRAQGRLLGHEAEAMLREAEQHGEIRLVRRVFTEAEDEGYDLNKLAAQLTEAGQVVVLLGMAGEKARFVFARSEKVPHDMVPPLREALAVLGTTRGGGRPGYASGGGVAANPGQMEAALETAARVILKIDVH